MSTGRRTKKPSAAASAELPEEPVMDPAVLHVQQALEANLGFFMSNIGGLIKRYDGRLEEAIALNAQAQQAAAEAEQQQAASAAAAAASAASPLISTGAADAAAAATDPTADAAASADKVDTVDVTFPDNTSILQQLQLLKTESYELSTTFDGVHDWIALNVPDMKEDDNTGVEVMSAVIEQIQSLNDAVRGVYGLEMQYLSDRGDFEKALLKLPESDTIMKQLLVQDSDEWDDIERGWRTLIRVCLIAYSVLAKNMTKLREPRGKGSKSILFM